MLNNTLFIICFLSAFSVHAQKAEEPGGGGMMVVATDGAIIKDTFQVTFAGKTSGVISKEEIKNAQRLVFTWKGDDSTWSIKSYRLMIYGKDMHPYIETATNDSLSPTMIAHLMQTSAGHNFAFQLITMNSRQWNFTVNVQPMTFTLKD